MDLKKKNELILKEIIIRCSKGERKAQECLYGMYFGYVKGIAMRYSANIENASEITNDSFLKIFNKIELHNNDYSFKAWIRKITVNTAFDYFRKYGKHEKEMPLEIIKNESFHDLILEKMNADEIVSLLQKLPAIYRITFNLYEIEGYSHDEIADQIGISSSTSRSNLSRAKKLLRELILKNKMS